MSHHISRVSTMTALSQATPPRSRPFPTRQALIFGGLVTGMVMGVAASLGVVMPIVHSEAVQNKSLQQKVVSLSLADSLSEACVAPSVSAAPAAGQVLGAAVSAAPQGGRGAGPVVPPVSGGAGAGGGQTFVQNLITQVAKSEATIQNTGPNSNNQITAVNTNTATITNTNNISVSNTSTQQASSGSATVTTNTNAGSATSGNASNANSTKLNINVKNQ